MAEIYSHSSHTHYLYADARHLYTHSACNKLNAVTRAQKCEGRPVYHILQETRSNFRPVNQKGQNANVSVSVLPRF